MDCTATTKAGKPCTAKRMREAEYCYRHNPAISDEEKQQAAALGGKKTAVLEEIRDNQPEQLRTIEGMVELIESNIHDVRSGKIDPKVSNAVVQNVNALRGIMELALEEGRVRRLEEHAGIESTDTLMPMGDK